jgi:hypothetical protein
MRHAIALRENPEEFQVFGIMQGSVAGFCTPKALNNIRQKVIGKS